MRILFALYVTFFVTAHHAGASNPEAIEQAEASTQTHTPTLIERLKAIESTLHKEHQQLMLAKSELVKSFKTGHDRKLQSCHEARYHALLKWRTVYSKSIKSQKDARIAALNIIKKFQSSLHKAQDAYGQLKQVISFNQFTTEDYQEKLEMNRPPSPDIFELVAAQEAAAKKLAAQKAAAEKMAAQKATDMEEPKAPLKPLHRKRAPLMPSAAIAPPVKKNQEKL